MAKVLFIITYEIEPEKREEYLDLVKDIRNHYNNVLNKNHNVFEHKGQKNTYSEIFTCNSRKEFDQLEDVQDEKTDGFIVKLDSLLPEGKMKYQTLIEIE